MVNSIAILFLCGLGLISAEQLKDDLLRVHYHLNLLKDTLNRNIDYDNIDTRVFGTDETKCQADMTELLAGLKASSYWALRMLDSWGSLPSGLLYGTFYDLGNFDECLTIHQQISGSQTIHGKYCFLAVPLKDVIDTGITSLEGMQIKMASCFPASCSSTEMEKFAGQFYQSVFKTNKSIDITIDETGCQTSDPEPWDGLTIFAIVILSLLTLIVTCCTFYDYFLCENQKQLPALVKIISARANSRALFRLIDGSSNPNVIECLHGIRCLSLIWVVYLHEHMYSLISPNINFTYALLWLEKPMASFFVHGYFSVDSFLFIGGLLVSMTALRTMEKTKGKLNVPMMYVHRIIRILPVLAMAILIYVKLMPVVSGGPLFKSGFHGKEECVNGWYWDLLFIQNYATQSVCLDQSWYLAVDMQLYILSPLLLIGLYKWGKRAAFGIVTLVILLSACLFATQMVNHYTMSIKNGGGDDEANAKLYLATHTHAAPWLIGFLFGYFLHLNRGKKFELSRLVVWSGWILCLAMIFTSIFALYPSGKWSAPPLPTVEESVYYTLTRVGWPLAMCWVVFACMQGYGGLANSLLSTPLWQPLSRLSYSVFIWHMFVQEVNSRNVRTSTYFSNYRVMLNFWSDFGISLVMSYVLYLIIEAPIGGLDALWRPSGNVKPPAATQPILSSVVEHKNNGDESENKLAA
ncbi:nose resistant to fluoxetine protein 6 isoform X1 [Drosophila biarmipes]|uniref:nose resistant to fluoxetine protein 6 isoform X1 n=2 Tax=Drosophila biarmipes TaxID=125945 RepID=UPI0021CCDEE6|nr:nose resistant to fluoxetine protein 6 isoform X1 [Drosophila biarmipes]